MFIFLDESGDLGFHGLEKSSEFFTMALVVCEDRAALGGIKRAVSRTLKNKVNATKRKKAKELKAASMSDGAKLYFLRHLPAKGISVYAMSVYKRRIQKKFRTPKGQDIFYNYMANTLLQKIPDSTRVNSINLILDRRKSKAEREHFNTYIRGNLVSRFPAAEGTIYISHDDSCTSAGLQAADLFAWGTLRYKYLASCGFDHTEECKPDWSHEFRHWLKEFLQFFG